MRPGTWSTQSRRRRTAAERTWWSSRRSGDVERSLQAARTGGRITVCGATSGPNPPAALHRIWWKQLTIYGSTMGTKADFEGVYELVMSGRAKPIVDRSIPLSEARAAHERMEAGDQLGKIVLTIPDAARVACKRRREPGSARREAHLWRGGRPYRAPRRRLVRRSEASLQRQGGGSRFPSAVDSGLFDEGREERVALTFLGVPKDAEREAVQGSSTASIVPSSAQALSRSPSPTRPKPWWCDDFTGALSPRIEPSRESASTRTS